MKHGSRNTNGLALSILIAFGIAVWVIAFATNIGLAASGGTVTIASDVSSCDVDSDTDGVADCSDGCPDDPFKTEPGICGCGVSDTTDSDTDGVVDCLDNCPHFLNADQADSDGDGIGDVCDATPGQDDTNGENDMVLPECGMGAVQAMLTCLVGLSLLSRTGYGRRG